MQITKQIQNGVLAVAFTAALLLPLTGLRQIASAAVDTCTWIGGTDSNFTTAANWSCSVDGTAAPEAGDTLQFTQIASTTTTTSLTNDMPLVEFAGIIVDATENTADVTETYSIDAIALVDGASITKVGTTDDNGTAIYSNFNSNGDLSISQAAASVISWWNAFWNIDGTFTLQDNVSGALLSGDFGDVVIGDNADAVVRGSNLGYLMNSITLGTSQLFITMYDENLTPDFDLPITVNGWATITFNNSQWYTSEWVSDDTNHVVSGTLTLNDNLNVSVANGGSVNFTGTINKNSNILRYDPYSLGDVNVDGKDLVPDPMSIGESDSSTDAVSASKNEVITLNGQRGSAYIYDGGSLKGSGTVTGNVNIATGGVIAPGESPGCFNIGGDLIMTGTYEFEIEGEDACDDYDQIIVAGDVSVTGATLDLARLSSYVPELNSEYILVQNDGSNAVTGEFDGWAQDAQVVVDQVTYEIDYAGGDGNDVVLTVVAIDSALAAEAGTPDTGLQSVLANPMIGVATLVISAGTLALLKKKQLI